MAKPICRRLYIVVSALLSLLAVQKASAFSIYGPAETWQTPVLDYITRYYYGNSSELGATKQLGEGSRLTVPIITYAYDYTFLNFFGAKGVAAVDAAMNELNSLPPANSPRLSKFLTTGNQQINYTAQALSLTDIKSTVMSLMLEHMGLIGETHVWDLHARIAIPNTTCEFQYVVINRNYDPVTYNPTPYVNGVQYGYNIFDGCTAGVQVADAIEQTVDVTSPANFSFTAVATYFAQQVGGYYLGITRDDMGGLAYLYRTDNFVYQNLDSNSVVTGVNDSTYNPVNTGATNNASSNYAGIFGGVNKITYVKVAFDSQIGQAFTPIIYNYSLPVLTNNTLRTVRVSRTVTQPDIIFASGDLVGPAFTYPLTYNAVERQYNFITNGAASLGTAVVQPSTITAQEVITFNNVTPIYIDASPSFLDSMNTFEYPILLWGSFNNTTNAPVVFPNGSSILALEQQILNSGPTITVGTYNPLLSPTSTNTTTQ
jgi:hypothetical protein